MAHEIEFRDGVASFAYAGAPAWHRLGKKVPGDLTPEQMLEAANLNWSVEKIPVQFEKDGEMRGTKHSALVRDIDSSVLDVVSDDWNPVQNVEAFEFFNDFCQEGDIAMECAGSLRGGKIVWGLGKVKDSFELFGGDLIESYLLFTNYHMFGYATDIRFTPVRVVCNNTLTLALGKKTDKMVRVSHRRTFEPGEAKLALGVAQNKLNTYKETAEFLGSKRFTNASIVSYFRELFPHSSGDEKRVSKKAEQALLLVDTQPGANFAPGTWWNGFNALTYMTDHKVGRTDEARLDSIWYGPNRGLKQRALDLAVEMAEAA